MKLLLSLVVIGSFALNAALAQTSPPKLAITGTVVAVTATLITVQKSNEAKFVWEIKMGPGTDTTVTGKQEVGATVTVNCIETNAQKKEKPDS